MHRMLSAHRHADSPLSEGAVVIAAEGIATEDTFLSPFPHRCSMPKWGSRCNRADKSEGNPALLSLPRQT